jgi:hypothetical protein
MDFSRADSRLIVSSGNATSINLRFGAFTPSFSIVLGSERFLTAVPCLLPVAAMASGVEVP